MSSTCRPVPRKVLQAMQGADARYVFPSTSPKADGSARAMSNMAMLTTLGRLGYRDRTTVHGLARATFSTWANETSAGRPDVVEACLAHEEGNRVRASYNRARLNDERRELLKAWAEYLARPAAPDVQLETKRARASTRLAELLPDHRQASLDLLDSLPVHGLQPTRLREQPCFASAVDRSYNNSRHRENRPPACRQPADLRQGGIRKTPGMRPAT